MGNVGELAGDDNSDNIISPIEVDFTIKELVVSGSTVFALTDSGLYGWGDNSYGQVGVGSEANYIRIPTKVQGIVGNKLN